MALLKGSKEPGFSSLHSTLSARTLCMSCRCCSFPVGEVVNVGLPQHTHPSIHPSTHLPCTTNIVNSILHACACDSVCPAGAAGPLLGEGVTMGLDEELDEAARQEREKMRAQFRPEDLAQYAIKGELLDCAGAAACMSDTTWSSTAWSSTSCFSTARTAADGTCVLILAHA